MFMKCHGLWELEKVIGRVLLFLFKNGFSSAFGGKNKHALKILPFFKNNPFSITTVASLS